MKKDTFLDMVDSLGKIFRAVYPIIAISFLVMQKTRADEREKIIDEIVKKITQLDEKVTLKDKKLDEVIARITEAVEKRGILA